MMQGADGLTTEQFVDKVAWRLGRYIQADEEHVEPEEFLPPAVRHVGTIDKDALTALYNQHSSDSGKFDVEQLGSLLSQLGVAPLEGSNKKSAF